MRVLDTPIIRDRTLGELALVVGLVACSVLETWERQKLCGNVVVYLACAAALALRLFAARALCVGLVLGAMAQVLPEAFASSDRGECLCLNADVLTSWAAALLLLCSRDLVQRYDRAPSRWPAVGTIVVPAGWLVDLSVFVTAQARLVLSLVLAGLAAALALPYTLRDIRNL